MNKKVFIGVSGGVDSSVSALLLQKQGYDVTGVFIKAWHPDFLPCNWRAEMRDAMRVCAKLGIPFLMCDLEKEYKTEVIDYLIAEYAAGRTPNPDILCNKQIKFGGFLKFAQERGADFVATGHYAQAMNIDGARALCNSVDTEKDQTYFLWTLTPEKLAHVLFPIGHLPKKEVRAIAEKHGLHTSTKKDSQGLCFIGHVDIKTFLRRYIKTKPGDVLNEQGNVIGTHDGSELYTIGERHGFLVDTNKDRSQAHYIISKDIKNNTITVTADKKESQQIQTIVLDQVSFTRISPGEDEEIEARIRYRGQLHPGVLRKNASGEYEYHCVTPIEQPSLGQSLVMYKRGECIGGGVITRTL
jgi:tRNA-specific 2-thiouridylase